MGEPLVSIVIPCFNAEGYVGAAIQSALAQTYGNREVIVIDDGSTDKSLDVIRSFGNAVSWETGPNRGGGAARNRGLALARGDLIQFLDADDWLHAKKLERQVAVAVQDPARIVYCNYSTTWEDNHVATPLQSPDCDESDAVVFILKTSGLQTAAPLHWKECLSRIGGFDERLPCAQERDLHLRIAGNGMHFRHLPEILFTVRRRRNSASSNLVRVLDQHSAIASRSYDMLMQAGTLTDDRAAALAGFVARDARGYLRHGLRKKAEAYFMLARRFHRDGGIPQAYGRAACGFQRIFGTHASHRAIVWRWWLRLATQYGL